MPKRRLTLIPLLGVAALVVVIAVAGGGEQRATFEHVAAHPERYQDREVRLTGRVESRPLRVPAALLGSFVLAGSAGERLLVIAAKDEVLPRVPEGERVTVRGTVVPVAPFADDSTGDRPRDTISAGDLAERVHAVALLRADDVEAG
ncbi:MAG TPA: hypothetical protein VFG79_02515 [Solirubrobacter sp.]|nr:hypothetical protein [Solirubrobacter sp.]